MPDELDKINLRSEEVQEILTKVPHWMIRWGNSLFFLIIILLLFISWFVKYPDIITTEALVTTKVPPQKIYAKTTGKFDTILVKNNEIVRSNHALAVIENTANFQVVFYLKSILDTVSISRKDFQFPFDKLPVLFLGELEADFALFENNYLAYSLNKELKPFSNEALANKISIAELKRRLQSTLSKRAIYKSELEYKKKDLMRSKTLFDKGIISSQEYEKKQMEIWQSKRAYKDINLTISQLKEAISNAEKNSRGTEIKRTKENIVLYKNLLQSYNQLRESIKSWELRYILQSKLNGKVSFLNYWNKNQLVNQGDLVFSIIPIANSSYIARLKAPIQNSGKIKEGQLVNIKLQNYPESEFGILKGSINNISLIPDKKGYYLIEVSLPNKLITSYHKEIEFKQEMRETADIITEDLRLIGRFFYQFKNILKRK